MFFVYKFFSVYNFFLILTIIFLANVWKSIIVW